MKILDALILGLLVRGLTLAKPKETPKLIIEPKYIPEPEVSDADMIKIYVGRLTYGEKPSVPFIHRPVGDFFIQEGWENTKH